MRLIYASTSSVPSTTANSVQVMRMCDAFAEAGHRVMLLADASGDATDIHTWYGTRHRFEIDTTVRSRLPVGGMVVTARRAARRAAAWRADLAYGRDPIALLGIARSGTPVVYEVHHPAETAARAAIEHRLLARPELRRLVAISDALARQYRPRLPARTDVLVAHDGADDPGPPQPSESTTLIGYVGSLRPGKGADVVAELARRMPGATFALVGGSPDEVAEMQRQAPPNLALPGAVRPSDVSGWLRRFAVALAPYGGSVHGASGRVDLAPWMSPLKVSEYLAHGLAIVASDLPVLREVLVDGGNAVLVPPGDVDAWRRAVSGLLEDHRQRASLAAAARSTFVDGLTWDARATAVLGGVDLA